MFAWMNREGKWLVVREIDSFGGKKPMADWTSDINKASVLARIPPKLDTLEVFKVPVQVEEYRLVTVKVETVDAAGVIDSASAQGNGGSDASAD